MTRPRALPRRSFVLAASAVALGLLSFSPAAWAQRTIKVVVPFPPGGSADILARLLGEQVGKTNGVTVVTENRPGGGASIAYEAVARAAPDANTLVINGNSLVINPHLRKVNYDPLTSFEPVCYLVSSPQVYVVNPDSPYRTLNDLINLVASRLKPPARLLYVAGEERAGDLAGALRARNFEVDPVVAYRLVGAKLLPEPAAAALGGDIDGVLHFSRQSAAAFINAARNSRLLEAALTKPVHFCISEQVAAPLRAAGAANIRVATRPDEQGLLELCG